MTSLLARDTAVLVQQSWPNRPLAGRTVLLVEDEMLILMDVEDMLLDLGCASVIAAATVDQALSVIGTELLDAALLDLNLSGDRSYAVADALAKCGVPFVFATGYGAHGLRACDRGRPVLVKPYRPAVLAKSMASLLRR